VTDYRSIKSIFRVLLPALTVIACRDPKPGSEQKSPSFGAFAGIKYIEVRRAFDTGLSFNEYGFQQEPEWILNFLPADSIEIYSPFEKKFLRYPVFHDHDSVFNIAREWLRLKSINKDSIRFQLLQVDGKEISKDRSNVYMTFYSDNYLKNIIHADPEILKRPTRRDSDFIRMKTAIANRNPLNKDSVFAARKPVVLKSPIPEIITEKIKNPPDFMNPSIADEYLNPEYKITIKKAYKDFNHSFTVFVDEKGQMHLGQFLVDPEFEESRRRVLNGIISVYLQKFLEITPGSTLGIPHTSEIKLYLTGRKASADKR